MTDPMDEAGFCNVCHVGYEAAYTGPCQEPAAFLSDAQLAAGDGRKCHGTVSLGEAVRMQRGRAERAEDALRKLAGIVMADGEAMDRGYLSYDVEYEGIVRDRASAAERILRDLSIEPPASPYSAAFPRQELSPEEETHG